LAFGAESPHADHIIPVTSENDPLFYDEKNIQFLHPECHGVKTKKDVAQGLTR
jgi:5-methylcytosine-specific restriction endonuclease McrA